MLLPGCYQILSCHFHKSGLINFVGWSRGRRAIFTGGWQLVVATVDAQSGTSASLLVMHSVAAVCGLLTSYVFPRSVSFSVLSIVGLQHLTPGLENCNFTDWWCHALQMVPNLPRKGFNSLVVLVAWWICKVGNREWLYFFGIFP